MVVNTLERKQIPAALALAVACWIATCPSTAQGGDVDPAKPPYRGTSTTFIKRTEIMTRDAFGRHVPPLPATQAVENILRYDAIWAAVLVARNNRAAWDLLRTKHPQVLTFYYLPGDSTRAVYDTGYFDYETIHERHPEWFVACKKGRDTRDPENRIRWTTDARENNYKRFYLDVANEAFQDWAVEQVLERVSGAEQGLDHGYHGLAMDNVHIGWFRLQSLHKRCPEWPYRDDPDAWNRGYLQYMKKVKRALNREGRLLIANHSLNYGSTRNPECWDALVESVDGAMTEQSLRWNHSPYYTNKQWRLSIERHERLLEHGVIDWWVCYPDDHDGFLYTYCSWLLTKKPGKSFYFATRGSRSWSNPQPPWYEEYELPLGLPAGERYERGGCWWRNFEHGRVVVNASDERKRLSLSDGVRWLDGSTRAVVTELVLAPASGRILVAVTGDR